MPPDYVWPLGNGMSPDEMNTSFGPRIDEDRWDFHDGIDLPAPIGTDVHAMRGGKVHHAGPILPWIILRARDLETAAIIDTSFARCLRRRRDRRRVVVEAHELRFRIRLRHDDRRQAMAAAHVRHADACAQSRFHAVECGQPVLDQVAAVSGSEEARDTVEELVIVFVPPSSKFREYVATPASHIIEFHLVAEGSSYITVGSETTPLTAGDIAIVPHGDPHIMGNGFGTEAIDAQDGLEAVLRGDLKPYRLGREAASRPASSAAISRAKGSSWRRSWAGCRA